MPVQKTESRLPAGFTASDLGQSNSSGDTNLISYLSSPVVRQRLQTYFVFVTNPAVAATIATYSWTVNDNGTPTNSSTTVGFLEYTPQNLGDLSVSVQLKDSNSATVATLSLQQSVVGLNINLEGLIDQQDTNIPSAAHPATSREIMNDLRMYADALLPPSQDTLFNKLILSIGYASSMITPELIRNYLSGTYASLINSNPADLFTAVEKGIGICKVRPQALAMLLDNPAAPGTPYIPFSELPTSGSSYKTTLQTIQDNFNALSQDNKIDLLNLLRFPKSNYRMVKLMIEKLKDKYFSGSTMLQILGEKNNACQLISQYFFGPLAAKMPSMTFAAAVFNIMQQPVWNIAALPIANGASVYNPGGSGEAPLGSPEEIPDLTFIAKARPNDNGYIRDAFLYHDTYGLNPVTFESFEDLVNKLSQSSSHISRMRLVSHFYIDPNKKDASNMFLPFFTPKNLLADNDLARYTIKDYFKFGSSDEEGLASIAADWIALIKIHVCDSVILEKPDKTKMTLFKAILAKVREANAILLQPFSLQGAGSSPSGEIAEFLKYCGDLYYFNHAILEFQDLDDASNVLDLPPLAKTAVTDYTESKIDQSSQALVAKGKAEADLNALKTFIANIDVSSLFSSPSNLGSYSVPAKGFFMADHTVFRQKLQTVKNRFDETSFIDIRGCRIGQDPGFLDAIKTFFGNPGNLPIVSAPDWYQVFSFLNWATPASEAQIDTIFKNGAGGTFAATDVQRDYANWSGRYGITSHVSFWTALAMGDPFDFLAFKWNSSIPGLSLPVVKLKDFGTLNFEDAIKRVGEIFNITASVPPLATLQSFQTSILPHLAALKTAADNVAVMNANTPVNDLNNINTTIQQVSTALQQSLGAPPGTMTLVYLTSSIQTLKAYATGQLNISPFLTAMKAKLAVPTAGLRYLQFIGLPLLVQTATTEKNLTLIAFDALKDDALKTWVKSQWRGVPPAAAALDSLSISWQPPTMKVVNNPADNNDDDLTALGRVLQVAGLIVDHDAKEVAPNPTYEYQQHIKFSI